MSESKRDSVIKRKISLPHSIDTMVSAKAFAENDGNFSGTLAKICRQYFLYIETRKQKLDRIERQKEAYSASILEFT